MSGLYGANSIIKRNQKKRWNDKAYTKRLLKKKYDSVIGNKPQAKCIVLEKIGIEAKQPNSGVRKACRVQCVATGSIFFAFVPGDGGLKSIEVNDDVLVHSLGKKGKSVGDRVGLKYKIVKVSGISLDGILRGKCEKPSK